MIEQELKELIIKKYNSLSKFAEQIDLAWTTLDGVLKRGVKKANITSLIKICNGLNIECEALYYGKIQFKTFYRPQNDFNQHEIEHLLKYRSLDRRGKEIIDIILEKEFELSQQKSEFYENSPLFFKPKYGRFASAGSGEYLFDNLPSENIPVPQKYQYADFIIGVHGDSMQPTFYDQDNLVIKKQQHLEIGDIGLFIIDGEAYVKEYQTDRLHSHNSQYPDIVFNEEINIQCVGKVLGKL